MNELGEAVSVRVDWSEVEEAHAIHVNQVLAQVGGILRDGHPDGVTISFGSAPIPAIMGDRDPEGTQKRLARLRTEGIKVNVVGQFHLSRQILDELINLLTETREKFDQAEAAAPQVAQGKQGKE